MYKKEGLTDGLQPSASANFSETCIIKTKKKKKKKNHSTAACIRYLSTFTLEVTYGTD